jgi:hypothetical protein
MLSCQECSPDTSLEAEINMTSDAQILAPPGAEGDGVDPRRWLTLVILLLAAFMNLLDV